ncbi:hypothetical protein CWI37_0098p0010 [Hamiltosporidium tvaerminnensis]|uniref:Uncharacterized protein n=1 Tax=Hamiltosporidium tvaerminnensis TaxID=1176355 RepID=A0A4Q9LC96_9MICR|nr:hypothetical protein CWI37_0098p0010 [Hamiltosporidium tvaerminnensis]
MLFFGQPGFNNPLSRSIVVENEAKTIVHSIIIDPDIVFSKKRQQIHNESWKSPRMYIKNLLKPDDLEIDSKICSEVAKNFKNYRERIIESNNSNKLKRDLSTEDQLKAPSQLENVKRIKNLSRKEISRNREKKYRLSFTLVLAMQNNKDLFNEELSSTFKINSYLENTDQNIEMLFDEDQVAVENKRSSKNDMVPPL